MFLRGGRATPCWESKRPGTIIQFRGTNYPNGVPASATDRKDNEWGVGENGAL